MVKRRLLAVTPLLWCLVALLAACTSPAPTGIGLPSAAEIDLQATAEAQATAIIARAQATALVLEAESQAGALIAAAASTITPQVEDTEVASPEFEVGTPPGNAESGPVEIVRVSFAAEGGFIIVDYKATSEDAEKFWPGVLSVTDESTGTVYDEVPVMPKIGPMISRPVYYGQVGYILFVNPPPGLPQGAQVTVKLAQHTFEHVIVE